MVEGKNRLILIIEDEEDILELLEYTLQKEGYETIGFLNANENVKKVLDEEKIDLILMDRNLPNIEGTSFIKDLRSNGYQNPVIYVTAKDKSEDILDGFEAHADDYITKPFNPLELIARVKSAYRRYTKYNEKSEENIIYINGLEIDQDKHICRLYETQIELTPMEFDILLYLAQKRGNVVSSEELFEKVWKEKYLENNNTVMVHIRRIREKLKENTKNPKFIKTVWGVGYKIEK